MNTTTFIMNSSTLELYAWIKAGSQKQKILLSLEHIKTPSEIQKETHIKFSNISDSLRKFQEKEIVKILNPESKKGRLYELTELGKTVLKETKLSYERSKK